MSVRPNLLCPLLTPSLASVTSVRCCLPGVQTDDLELRRCHGLPIQAWRKMLPVTSKVAIGATQFE
jgi:hypothetical protein